MWNQLQKVKLKNYIVHRPTPSYAWKLLAILLICFGVFALAKIGTMRSSSKVRYCDTYVEPYYDDCIRCPPNQYCYDGKIIDWSGNVETPKQSFFSTLKRFAFESAKVLLFFCIVAVLILAFHYRKQWIDQHIAQAETLYKELLVELTNANPQMIAKKVFARRLDKSYSPKERKFLEEKLEEIRLLDEQVTFVNEDGHLYYVWASS